MGIDTLIKAEIEANGNTAPRVTYSDIEANIVSAHYFTAADGVNGAYWGAPKASSTYESGPIPQISLGLLTFCVLILSNGFTVTGESACASAENFDAEIHRKIARAKAVKKIWPLMGYALKVRLHERDSQAKQA